MIQEMPTEMLFREECTIEGKHFLNFMKKRQKGRALDDGRVVPQGQNHPRSKLLNNAKIVTAHTQLTQHFDESKRSETQDQIQKPTGNGTGKG